jgi:hypothetical protein
MAKAPKATQYVVVTPIGKPRINMMAPSNSILPGQHMVVDADQADFFQQMGMVELVEEDFDMSRYNYTTGEIKPKAEVKDEKASKTPV